MQRESVILID